jgi:hypothetical protein
MLASMITEKRAALRMVARDTLARARNLVGCVNPYLDAPLHYSPETSPRVLVLGIYMAGHPNLAAHLVDAFQRSKLCRVEQRWVGLGGKHEERSVRDVTVEVLQSRHAKFTIINRLLASIDVSAHDFLVVSDDDIRVRSGFLDSFIGCQEHYDFAIAQPARTVNSFNDHAVVRRRVGSRARQTWFVEIGPCFSLRSDAADLLLPFDEASPMGYGYDLVWPAVMRKAGKSMGVIDCCPVDHSFRRRGATYHSGAHIHGIERFLTTRDHVSYSEAMKTVKWLR